MCYKRDMKRTYEPPPPLYSGEKGRPSFKSKGQFEKDLISKSARPHSKAANRKNLGSALVLKYSYGHFECGLCPRNSIVRVLNYRFKFFHLNHIEYDDDGRMEIRPLFGVGPPVSAEGDKFDMERNTIFLNIGEGTLCELLISWYSRRLQLLLPVVTFVVGLLLGVLPFPV